MAAGPTRHRWWPAPLSEPSAGGSAIRRLLDRARNAWENESLWVAFVIGLLMVPSFDGVLLIVAIIVASGAAISTQISAAVAFVVGMLAVEEIILAFYLVTPAQTEAVVRRLHHRALTHVGRSW
jgi:phosphotransferase system  glucose/maltose/N-acetylglucosamine-specific IIC component